MKKLIYVLMLLTLVQIFSCKCDNVVCADFNPDYLTWIKDSISDSLTFINSAGSRIKFIVTEKTASKGYVQEVNSNWTGCHSLQCFGDANLKAVSDTSRGNNSIDIRLSTSEITQGGYGDNEESRQLSYSIFDCYNSFIFAPTIKVHEGDYILDSLVLGGNTYRDVIVSEIDTTISINLTRNIWKTYFNNQNGVIGFFDRQTHSLFYRE